VAGETDGTSPLEVSFDIDRRAGHASDIAHELLSANPANTRNGELRDTLQDIIAMANLGQYYAAKIRGAAALAQFRATRVGAWQQTAIDELTHAQVAWQKYTENARARYRNPVWTNRVGYVDWTELDAEVARDIVIASAPSP
jgi:hypothetical protein